MKCVVCKSGETCSGTIAVTLEREGLTRVLKEVPAEICINCGGIMWKSPLFTTS